MNGTNNETINKRNMDLLHNRYYENMSCPNSPKEGKMNHLKLLKNIFSHIMESNQKQQSVCYSKNRPCHQ